MAMRNLHRLSEKKVKTTKKTMVADGGQLWLQTVIGKNGSISKSWIFRYGTGEMVTSKNGKTRQRERAMGLGAWPTVTLTAAREKAAGLRKAREAGIDPLADKASLRAAPGPAASSQKTFKDVLDSYIKANGGEWRSEKHRQQWIASVETHAADLLDLPVSAVDDDGVQRALDAIWHDAPVTADRVRGRLERILEHATAKKWRSGDNPAGQIRIVTALGTRTPDVAQRKAMEIDDLPAFMRALAGRDGVKARALEFTILTAARNGEVRNAQWREIDWTSRSWTVPAEKMKRTRPHQVPLCDRALGILRDMMPAEGQPAPEAYIFGTETKPLPVNAMKDLLKAMERTEDVHGFRGSFKQWGEDETSHEREVIEAALAHVLGDKAEQAYRGKIPMVAKRRVLMADWADFLAGIKKPKAKPEAEAEPEQEAA
jgi:integrase